MYSDHSNQGDFELTKAELLKMVEGLDDDEQIWFVSSDYEIDDDLYWNDSHMTEVQRTEVCEYGNLYIHLDTSEFM